MYHQSTYVMTRQLRSWSRRACPAVVKLRVGRGVTHSLALSVLSVGASVCFVARCASEITSIGTLRPKQKELQLV